MHPDKTSILFPLVVMTFMCSACEEPIHEFEKISGEETGHGYVDLGLSVMWAATNLGANHAYDFGDYYSWGEIEAKEYFGQDNYRFSNGGQHSYTKYCFDPTDGKVDGLTELRPEDDAANVQWGGSWRMPTNEELRELLTKCSWEYKEVHRKKGWVITSPNGNSIFLPLAGSKMWNESYGINSSAVYRSSSLSEKYSSLVFAIYLHAEFDSFATWTETGREMGTPIRAVCVKQK